MPHKYFVFPTPASARVGLAHDSGWSATAVPGTDPQGRSGQVFEVPDTVPDQAGAQLNLDADGKVPLQLRGVLVYADTTRAYLQCDDFTMVDLPTAPPIPPPNPNPSSPLEVINGVYATGQFNLATHVGCGQFTEECCRQLATAFGAVWGHVAKSPGQNQYNAHAVDAVMSLAGSDHGIWDIIVSSVSSSARPAFNRAGDSKPELWRPPAPLPEQPAVTAMRITVDLSIFDELLALALAALKRLAA
jgi:hypothetical protein